MSDEKLLSLKRFNNILRKCWRTSTKLSSDDIKLSSSGSNYHMSSKKNTYYSNCSLDMIRNKSNKYEVVLPYQRYIKKYT